MKVVIVEWVGVVTTVVSPRVRVGHEPKPKPRAKQRESGGLGWLRVRFGPPTRRHPGREAPQERCVGTG
jgi:uncharacterized membrane protein YagU involved in acid resistance